MFFLFSLWLKTIKAKYTHNSLRGVDMELVVDTGCHFRRVRSGIGQSLCRITTGIQNGRACDSNCGKGRFAFYFSTNQKQMRPVRPGQSYHVLALSSRLWGNR